MRKLGYFNTFFNDDIDAEALSEVQKLVDKVPHRLRFNASAYAVALKEGLSDFSDCGESDFHIRLTELLNRYEKGHIQGMNFMIELEGSLKNIEPF